MHDATGRAGRRLAIVAAIAVASVVGPTLGLAWTSAVASSRVAGPRVLAGAEPVIEATTRCEADTAVGAPLAVAATEPREDPPRDGATPKPEDTVSFDATARARILRLSPLPPPPPDPTNRFADDPRAARLGQALFHDPRLSANGRVACATCHEPARAFTDGRALAQGLATGRRSAPTLRSIAHQRWFFWDGRADTLWAQALHPIEDPREMGGDRRAVLRVVADDPGLARAYEATFGPLPPLATATAASTEARVTDPAIDRAFANVGKALAAYERHLDGGTSAFDRFVAAWRADDAEAARAYPLDARRGLALFVGRAGCTTCHAGPLFSDGEFHDVGVPGRGGVGGARDPGRRAGVAELLVDPFRSSGAFSDAPDGERARELEQIVVSDALHAQMRTPTLRNVARTAPYMHAGQFATLRDVLEFYSTRAGAVPAGHHAESILRPLALTPREIEDLLAFLATLDDDPVAPEWVGPPPREDPPAPTPR